MLIHFALAGEVEQVELADDNNTDITMPEIIQVQTNWYCNKLVYS